MTYQSTVDPMLREVWPSFTKSQKSPKVPLSSVAESATRAHLLADGLLGDPNTELRFGGHLHLSASWSFRSLFWMHGGISGHELKGWHGAHAYSVDGELGTGDSSWRKNQRSLAAEFGAESHWAEAPISNLKRTAISFCHY